MTSIAADPRRGESQKLARRLIAAYAPLGRRTQLYVALRLLTAPLIRTARLFPAGGRVLDLGCGHGIFAHLLHETGPERQVVGVDLMANRIEAARRTAPADGRLSFAVGDARAFPEGPFDVIACIDLLHHMPWEAQVQLLRLAVDALPPGGTLIVKDLERRPYWKFAYHYVQDWIMYRFQPLFFRSREDMTALLEGLGLDVTLQSLATGPYPHIAYLARRKRAA